MINSKRNVVPTKRLVLVIMLSNLLINCIDDKEPLIADDSVFEVVVKTDADSLSMYPSSVSKRFLDTSYTSLFNGYLKNGEITFKGRKPPYPYMFDFFEEEYGQSDKFFVDHGRTEVSVSFKTEKGKIKIEDKSKTQLEYEELKALGLNEVDSLMNESKTTEERAFFRLKRDSVITNYIQKNPTSYVPLWLMVNYIDNREKRYNKLYDGSLHLFSDDIKKTGLFKSLKDAIEYTKENAISNTLMKLKNFDLETVSFKVSDMKNKEYILIDFWYSNCGPCLIEMPKYIPLYQKYKDRGFEIVSISKDKTNKIKDWKDTIKNRNFNWVHYLDENGVETAKQNITAFPTTFLIDDKGEVLKYNISSQELKIFLNESLKE
jgi:thiol-disulfide isomerase/thioredoxin